MASFPPRLPDAIASLYPFTSRWYSIEGYRLHYLDEGEGEVVVMLHGNPTWSFFYRHLILGLRESYRVLVPDHMGCGLSEKPQCYPYTLATHIQNLEQLLATVEDPVTLILHDWGGPIGMGWAIRQPERVRRLIILNTAAFRSSQLPWRIAICRWPMVGTILVRGFNAFVRAALGMAVAKHERMTPLIAKGYLFPYDSWANRIAIHRFVQDIPLRPSQSSYRWLHEIEENLPRFHHTPLLLQWGGRDWCFHRGFLEEWLHRFPHAAYDCYDDAGHWVLEDAYEKILPRILSFLRE